MKLIGLVSGWIALAAMACGATMFNVVDLGSLGGNISRPAGISESGQVVGMATDAFNNFHAVTFSPGGPSSLAGDALATGVNDAGQISGVEYLGGTPYATIWEEGAPHTLAGPGSFAMAINQNGQAAGMLGNGHAFVANNGHAIDIGTLAGGWTSAYGINNTGQVTGYGDLGAGRFGGFVWSAKSGYQTIGTFGGQSSYAMAINDSGQAVGHAQTSAGYLHAFLSSGSVLRDLGTLGGASSFAYGINSQGIAVGSSYTANWSEHGFVYQNGVLLDLNGLIDPASGWVLTQAVAINDAGQIAGSGWFHGSVSAFRLDPVATNTFTTFPVADPAQAPEPGALWLCGAGLAIAVLVHRMRASILRPQPRA